MDIVEGVVETVATNLEAALDGLEQDIAREGTLAI